MKIQKILKIKVLILLLVLAGCASPRFQPIPGEYQVENGWVVLRTDSLIIMLKPQHYRSPNGTYQNRSFSLYIRAQNIAKQNVALPAGSFQLLADGKQYSPFSTEMLLSGYPIYYDLAWQDPFNQSPEALRARQNWEDDRYSLIADSFGMGEILSGGKKEGYLFYHEAVARAQKLELDVLGTRISFSKTK
ncbi:MAG: hypothetical protein WCY84_05200 [Candidatus Cloacimonadaceae bacterium]